MGLKQELQKLVNRTGIGKAFSSFHSEKDQKTGKYIYTQGFTLYRYPRNSTKYKPLYLTMTISESNFCKWGSCTTTSDVLEFAIREYLRKPTAWKRKRLEELLQEDFDLAVNLVKKHTKRKQRGKHDRATT